MIKKILLLAALAGGGTYFAKKHMGMEDATVGDMVDRVKEQVTAPIEQAQDAAKKYKESAKERMHMAEEALAEEK